MCDISILSTRRKQESVKFIYPQLLEFKRLFFIFPNSDTEMEAIFHLIHVYFIREFQKRNYPAILFYSE